MSVGHDVAVSVDDHARTHRVLANDQRRPSAVTVTFVQRPVSGGLNLHHRGRDSGGQLLQRTVHLPQDVGRIGRVRISRKRFRFIRRLFSLRLVPGLLGKAKGRCKRE